MTDDTIHTCSYSCERPGCIRAQRDELVAKVEALWAEVENWKESFCQAASRAERLAEALEEIQRRSSIDLAMRSDQFELTARLGDIYQIADAALAKENKA